MLLTRIALSLHVLTCVALAGGCTSECDDSGMLQRLPGTALVEGAGIRPRFRGRGSGHLGRLKKLTRQRGGSRRFVRGSGKLFISAEANGFVDMREENEIPFLRGKFTTAALIYLTVSHIGMMDFYREATARVKKNNPGLQIEYWLQFDTDQHDSTPTSKCATVGAASCATYIKEYIEKTNPQLSSKVAGIHFDNEGVGGNLKAIVEAWDQVRSELGVKISFTKGIGNCGTQTIFGVSFDYCLGQSYTDDTAKIYVQTPCGGINTKVLWEKWAGKVTTGGYSVPMLCAGGNCQGDLPGFLVSHGGPCNIDERLSTSGIAEVVQSIDISLYPNMALWYGSGVQPQICPRCTADEKVDLSGVDCNLLTAVIDCNYPSPVLCTKALRKCEGPEWQKEGWSTYCKANGKCHFSQVKPPTPCSEFRMEIEACKSLSSSSLWGFGAGACSFNNPDLHPIPVGPMQDFVDEQVSTKYTYLGGSKITNCTPDGLLCTHGDGNPSAKNLGACQRQLGGMGQLLDEKAEEFQDICDVDEDLKKTCGGSCLRGMCLDKLPPAPAGALKMPKILLYHGGIVGAPAFSTPCYRQYLDDVLRFVIEKNINTILLNVMAPIPKSTSHDAQFPYYEDPAWIAANFLDRLPPSVKAGALFGNVKLDSSGWNFQNSSFNIYKDKLLGGAGLGLAPGCTGHDLSKCSCSDLKALISAPHRPVDQSACLTAGNCPAGCPNLAAQVVTWLASVNAKAKNVKFSTLSFDGEDGGESAPAWALCHFKLLGDELGIPEVGMAKSIAAGPQSPGVTYTMPETYWYMGELWPCTGDQWQLKEKPPVCTTQSSYRSFVDKAWPFLNWLNISDKVMQEKPGFPSLIDNIRWVKTNAPGKAVIPMFSFEGLSLKSCFATHFSAGVKNVSDICGTFDGFSFWQWETFKEFMIYFADAFQVDEVGIYDLQFIPPYWFDNKAFGPNDDCKASAR